jgi:hypothetical protein
VRRRLKHRERQISSPYSIKANQLKIEVALTKWGELIVGMVFMLLSFPIFFFSITVGALVSAYGGFSGLFWGGIALGALFFFGGIAVMVRSHEPSGSDITIGVRSSGPTQAAPSAPSSSGRRKLSSLAKTILINLPHGKTIEEISRESGVDESIVVEKVQNLRSGGFLTEGDKLTQQGYEAIQPDTS